MTEPGAYQFQVRTVSAASHSKSEWTVSDVLTVKQMEALWWQKNMPEPDGRRQQTDFAGGGEMRTAPGPSPNGWNRGAGGIILMTRAIWLQDGSAWTASGITWIGKMEICM